MMKALAIVTIVVFGIDIALSLVVHRWGEAIDSFATAYWASIAIWLLRRERAHA